MSKNIARKMLHEGRFDEALILLMRACDTDPDDAEAWCLSGAIYGRTGDMKNAVKCLSRAIAIKPDYIEALLNLVNAYIAAEQLESAEKTLHSVLSLDKSNYHALTSLAYITSLCGKLDAAYNIYRDLYRRYPDNRETSKNLAKISCQLSRFDEAERLLCKAINSGPDEAELILMMGDVKRSQGFPAMALDYYRRYLCVDETNIPVLLTSGFCSLVAGLHKTAIEYFDRVSSIDPDSQKGHHARLSSYNYFSRDCREIFSAHKSWGEQQEICAKREFGVYEKCSSGHNKLRVGYVSPDFYAHSVAFFIESLLRNHDRGRFEIYCFSDVPKDDSVTVRLRSYNVVWVDTHGSSNADVIEQIRKAEIDILVDLSGHTAGNRLTVFAAKPAALQVSYLGYPNTTGLTTIDYRMTDELTDPVGISDQWYTEKLFRLPNGFLCYTPPLNIPVSHRLKSTGDREVVFGSFNNISKITPEVIDVWSQILLRNKHSSIVFKHKVTCDVNIKKRLLKMFGMKGIDAARIRFLPWTCYYDEHMAAYNAIDIALDTFPYNGTTTTFESLWMAVPVIALKGTVHAGRVGFSILSGIGMEDLVADSESDYVDLAIKLSRDQRRLFDIRSGLRGSLASSLFCDGGRFTKEVECAYEEMWNEVYEN